MPASAQDYQTKYYTKKEKKTIGGQFLLKKII